ncbi:MAG TPA: hypothetical protein VMM38_10325 [Aridibacter sp.]|nr:hypothetical protein [Aridibacter sp.]
MKKHWNIVRWFVYASLIICYVGIYYLHVENSEMIDRHTAERFELIRTQRTRILKSRDASKQEVYEVEQLLKDLEESVRASNRGSLSLDRITLSLVLVASALLFIGFGYRIDNLETKVSGFEAER